MHVEGLQYLFKMYIIDSRMNCYPCSFGIWVKDISESMSFKTITRIGRGEKFIDFRERRKGVECSNGGRRGVLS